MKSDVFARGHLTHLFDPSATIVCVSERGYHTRASAKEFLRARKTDVHAETSRWTHTSGSKPGRADRSGQSASARSLFKVRLTLSTVPEKKSMPVFPGTRESTSSFLLVSLSLYVRSHQSTSPVVSRPENS